MGKGRDKRRKLKARQATSATTRVVAVDTFRLEDVQRAVAHLEEHDQRSVDGCYTFPVMPGSALDQMAQRAAKEDVMTPELMRAAVAMGPAPQGVLIVSPNEAKRGGAR